MDNIDGAKGELRIYVNINNTKVKNNNNESEPNYNLLQFKTIPKDKFNNLSLKIVNDIKIDLMLKIKNGPSSNKTPVKPVISSKTTVTPKIKNQPPIEQEKKVDPNLEKIKGEEERKKKEEEEKKKKEAEKIKKQQEDKKKKEIEQKKKLDEDKKKKLLQEKKKKEKKEKKRKEEEEKKKLEEDRIKKEEERLKQEEEERIKKEEEERLKQEEVERLKQEEEERLKKEEEERLKQEEEERIKKEEEERLKQEEAERLKQEEAERLKQEEEERLKQEEEERLKQEEEERTKKEEEERQKLEEQEKLKQEEEERKKKEEEERQKLEEEEKLKQEEEEKQKLEEEEKLKQEEEEKKKLEEEEEKQKLEEEEKKKKEEGEEKLNSQEEIEQNPKIEEYPTLEENQKKEENPVSTEITSEQPIDNNNKKIEQESEPNQEQQQEVNENNKEEGNEGQVGYDGEEFTQRIAQEQPKQRSLGAVSKEKKEEKPVPTPSPEQSETKEKTQEKAPTKPPGETQASNQTPTPQKKEGQTPSSTKPKPDAKNDKKKEVKKTNTKSKPGEKEKAAKTSSRGSISSDFMILDPDATPDDVKEIYPDTMTYDKYSDELKQKKQKEDFREAFCEGFFIASFPRTGGKVIEKSSVDVKASCGHEECSRIPAMKPEIVMRYPLNDTKTLELNNLAATICFPTGIKLCYSETEEPKNIEDYVTQITNQKGERYYMRTFHFYHKMQNSEFTNKYSFYPLKHLLMTFGDEYLVLSEEEIEKHVQEIQQNLDFAQNLGFRDYIYIPYCICLISKYSYISELEICLSSIYKIISQKPDELNFLVNDLIMYLIHSVPIPEKHSRVRFYLPYAQKKLELLCPKADDVAIMNSNFTKLFDYLSADNIILIFRLILTEKKILFVDDDYSELTNVTDAFTTLLYPFKWIHTYIPIMSDQMLKYLETFLPFVNGIHTSLMNRVEALCREGEIEEKNEVFLIYIKKDEIKLSSSFKNDKKNKFSKYVKDNVLPLPFEKEFRKELKNIEYYVKNLKKDEKSRIQRLNYEKKMRELFVELFVKMFHDYEKFIGVLDDDVVFNKVLFMKTINKDEKFYDEFIDCQLFQQFTQNIITDEYNYFKKKVKEYKDKERKAKKSGKENKPAKEEKILYIIKPNYLGITENNRELYRTTIDAKYKYDEKDKKKNAIIEDFNFIAPEKYDNSKCEVYLTSENKEAMKELKSQEEESLKMKGAKSGVVGEEMTERQIDQIKEEIRDIVIKIFKSQINEKDISEKKNILSKLDISIGRSFFISLITNNKNVLILQENAFNYLSSLIQGLLVSMVKLPDTDTIIEQCVLLVKNTKLFAVEKVEKKKSSTGKVLLTIYEDRKKNIMEFVKIDLTNFWEIWFDLEIKRLKDDGEEPDEQRKTTILNDICKQMIDLKMKKTYIKKACDSINDKIYTHDSEDYIKVSKNYMKFITEARYISGVKE